MVRLVGSGDHARRRIRLADLTRARARQIARRRLDARVGGFALGARRGPRRRRSRRAGSGTVSRTPSCRSTFGPCTPTDLDQWGEDAPGRGLPRRFAKRSRPSSARRRNPRTRRRQQSQSARSQHLRAALRQHERRSGAGVFLRRHHRGRHHRPRQGVGAVDRLAQHGVLVQGREGRRRARSARQTKASPTCWSAACAKRGARVRITAQLVNAARTTRRSGASATTATRATSSRCRTRSRRRSSPR